MSKIGFEVLFNKGLASRVVSGFGVGGHQGASGKLSAWFSLWLSLSLYIYIYISSSWVELKELVGLVGKALQTLWVVLDGPFHQAKREQDLANARILFGVS